MATKHCFSRLRVSATGLWVCPGTDSWCCMSSAFSMLVSTLTLGPLLLVGDVAHVAHVVSKWGSGTRCTSDASSPFCFRCESFATGGYHAGSLQRLRTMNEKGKKVRELILLPACTYQVDNAKGQMYNLRTLRNARIRLAKLKKGCFWGFVANEDDKEDKKRKKKKKAEPAKPKEQPKKVKDKKMEKAKPPKPALKKPKMEEEDDDILQIKPMHKAPWSTVLEKEDDADDEDQSEDKSTSSPSETGYSSSSCLGRPLRSLRRSLGTFRLPDDTFRNTTAMGVTLLITATRPSISMVAGINQVGSTAACSNRSYHKRRERRRRGWMAHHTMTLCHI